MRSSPVGNAAPTEQMTWVNMCEAAAHFPTGDQKLVFTVDTSGTTGTQMLTRAAASAWAVAID